MESGKKKKQLKLSIRASLYVLLLAGISALFYKTLFTGSWNAAASGAGSRPAAESIAALNGEPLSQYAPAYSTSALAQQEKTAMADPLAQSEEQTDPKDPDFQSSDSAGIPSDSTESAAEGEEENSYPADPSETDAQQESRSENEQTDPDTEYASASGQEKDDASSEEQQAASSLASIGESTLSSAGISLESASADDLGYPIVPRSLDAVSRTILIDPGHGGTDTGDAAKDGTVEKNVTLAMAQSIAKHLKIQNPNLNVVLLREGDSLEGASSEKGWEDLIWRRKKQEETGADYFLSLHAHDDDGQKAGYSFVINPDDPVASSLCAAIESALQKEGWGSGESLTTTDQYPLQLISLASSHSAQLNLGVLSNEDDLNRLSDEQSVERAGAAIASAISSTVQENASAADYVSRARQNEQKAAEQAA